MRHKDAEAITPQENISYSLIIPARFKSSRFPGKPLALVAGKPLIERVWRQCLQAVPAEKIVIATDDERIADVCRQMGADVELTSEDCLTGTDRVHQVVRRRNLSWAVNVQGDEPFVRPEDIQLVIQEFMRQYQDAMTLEREPPVVNAMAPIYDKEEWLSPAIPKVVCDNKQVLLYMSRAAIPGNKDGTFYSAWKQICIYAFTSQQLAAFSEIKTKTALESHEDIEILRFLEAGYRVQMVKVKAGTIAIDYPADIKKAEDLLDKMAT